MVSVGTIVWLASELMFFAALFAMYFPVRSVFGPQDWPTPGVTLDLTFAAVNTTVLVLSSVTCQFGVFAAERRADRPHPAPSPSSGSGDCASGSCSLSSWAPSFISGQTYEYMRPRQRRHHGSPPDRTARCSFLTTASMACTSPVGSSPSCSYSAAPTWPGGSPTSRRQLPSWLSYYWHFVDVVWIGLVLDDLPDPVT
jgi:cytochrome c oxidase subunit 3